MIFGYPTQTSCWAFLLLFDSILLRLSFRRTPIVRRRFVPQRSSGHTFASHIGAYQYQSAGINFGLSPWNIYGPLDFRLSFYAEIQFRLSARTPAILLGESGGGLVTGGALIGLLAMSVGTGHHVPDWVAAVAGIVLATYFVWSYWHKSEFDHDLVEVPKYANVYVEQVIFEYESLGIATARSSDERASQIIKAYRSDGKTTWGELYGLERLLVQLETTECLRARIIHLRARHAALIGTAAPALPAFDTAKPDADGHLVRAYVESALREVNRLLAVTACRERLRKRRLAYVATIGLFALSALITLAAFLRHMDFQQWIWLVLIPLVGALGGLISSQRRVQSIPSVGESLTDMTNLHFFRSSLTVSAMSGAIFAAILCMLFASGLLSGSLFPTVDLSDRTPFDPSVHMTSADLGRLLIWCFIAGFAERFVPDTLDRLVSRSAKER